MLLKSDLLVLLSQTPPSQSQFQLGQMFYLKTQQQLAFDIFPSIILKFADLAVKTWLRTDYYKYLVTGMWNSWSWYVVLHALQHCINVWFRSLLHCNGFTRACSVLYISKHLKVNYSVRLIILKEIIQFK